MHSQTKGIPLKTSAGQLTAIAKIVENYKCHDSVSFFGRVWSAQLGGYDNENSVDFDYDSQRDDILNRLFIAFVFRDEEVSERLTMLILRHDQGPLSLTQDHALPDIAGEYLHCKTILLCIAHLLNSMDQRSQRRRDRRISRFILRML